MDNKNRVKKLRKTLKKLGLDAFLVISKTNRTYLSGFTGSKGYFLLTLDKADLYVDDRYTIRAKKESSFKVLSVENLKKNLNGKKVGIEDSIRLAEYQLLKKMKSGAKLVITSNVIEEIRSVKENRELNLLRRGSRLIDTAFAEVVGILKAKKPIREIDLAQHLEEFAKLNGADGLAFDPIVAFGKNAAGPHHFSSSRKIGQNNFLLFDFGMKIDGYHTDFTRTVFLGKPTEKQKQVYEIVREAQQLMIDKIKPGIRASEVDLVGRGYIEKKGYGDKYTHNGGHGVGLVIHELPNFSSQSDEVLRPGMVITVEPGIYLEGKFGVRIEDMVLVTEKGAKVLSKIPKDFESMLIK